ncbi:MAG: PKD domain-containing protein, partial [Chloroflexota bacterium]
QAHTALGASPTAATGAGIGTSQVNLVLTNVLLSGNYVGPSLVAGNQGSGLWASSSTLTLNNVTVAGNHTYYTAPGGAIYLSSTTLNLNNSIVWGNTYFMGGADTAIVGGSPTASYSDVQGGVLPGGGNLSADPRFVSPLGAVGGPNDGGNYRLQASPTRSPAINAGSDLLIPAGVLYDLDGHNRTVGAAVDMGAYEDQTVDTAPALTTHPTSQSVTAGQTATFTAAASGYPTPTVKWQVSTDASATWNDLTNGGSVSGATSGTLTLSGVTTTMSGYQYKAVFSNGVGSPVNSNAAILTVTPAPVAPTVTTQPGNQTVLDGGTATFTAAASGTPTPTVQWQVSTDGTNWANIASATSPTLSFTAAAGDNGKQYRAVFSNTAGTANSNAATLTVTAANTAPVVDAGAATASVNEGSIFAQAGSFTDPDTNSWTATVDYGDGTGVQALSLDQAAKTISLSHTYADNGSYTVTVTVDDGTATGTDTVLVTVNNVAPSVNAGAATVTISAGGTFSQSGSFTDPGADTWQATVNYGDDTGVQPLTLTGKTFSLSHVYDTPGAYTVTVVVTETDAEAASGQGSVVVTVDAINAPPTAPTNPSPADGATGVAVSTNLSWTASSDPQGDPVSYQVLLSTVNPPVATASGCGTLLTTTCDPSADLAAGTTYYWRVVASDGQASTNGTVWSFTTAPALVGSADLTISVKDSPDPAKVGDQVTYAIVVSNKGPQVASAVEVSLGVPEGTTLKAFAPPIGWTCPDVVPGVTDTITCSKASMAVREKATFELEVTVEAGVTVGTVLSFTASVTSAATGDPQPANNTITVTTTAVADELKSGKPVKPGK